jgi:hypothetical protein
MLCSSTAAAVDAMNSFTLSIAPLIAESEPTTSPAMLLSESISLDCAVMSVAYLDQNFSRRADSARMTR